ncbi:MAG: HAD family hydrolase, partial [bacterium]
MLKAVLFDLDGTLLPMDQEYFVEQYLLLLAKTVGYLGYEAKPLIRAVWAGTEAMFKNDGSCTNEAAFWRRFRDFYPAVNEAHIAAFDSFYAHEFDAARAFCGFDPGAAEAVRLTQKLG